MITKSLQAAALQDLREKAVIVHKTLADEAKRIKKLLSTHLHPRSHQHVPNALSHYTSNSQAETTITRHSDRTSSIDTPRPMVVKQDGKSYPTNPSNGYVSKYPDSFFGCLGCGSTDHQFRKCKDNRNHDVRKVYWQELWAHFPHTQKRPAGPLTTDVPSNSITSQTPPVPPTSVLKHGLGRGSHVNRPAWHTSDKRPRFFTISVLLSNISSPNQKPMPISINNSLPSVHLNVGLLVDEENKMRMLLDTSAAMNTGNLAYHQWVMSQCPSMVAEYLECGDGTEYDVVQLLAALDLKGTHQPVNHGSMTAVIRYRTPYLINNTSPLILSFALGKDVALRSVLGIPCLLAMGAIVDLVKGQLRCSELNQEFMLQLDPPGKGLPDGTQFDSSNTSVPAGVSSNVPSLASTLQYTSSDGIITPVIQNNVSNNLVVTDTSFHGCISRELVYKPPTPNTST